MRLRLALLLAVPLSLCPAPAATVEYTDGTTVKMNPSGNVAGLNVGAHTSDPATLNNGDLWYNSTANALKARINGATVSLGAGGGGSTTLTSTYVGYGDGSDAVTGEAAFSYTAASDLLTLANLYATTAIEVGAASDTTLTRSSAGNLSVEGNLIYRAGGTDVPVTDGGTGASTASDARTNLGLGTAAVLATSTGGNSTTDSGKAAVYDASGNLRGESLLSDLQLSVGTTNTLGTGGNVVAIGYNNVVTGTADNVFIFGNTNTPNTSSGYGMLSMFGTQNNITTTAAFGANGYVLANGVQHFGVAENSFASGFHNALDGRGTFDTASLATLVSGTQVNGAGGSAMMSLGAGGHAYWHGCVFLSSHHNKDGGQIWGDVSSRSSTEGTVSAGASKSTVMELSITNDKRLVLKPNRLYVFDICVAAGFITVQEWCASWNYQVTVHQGATGTTPLIRSVVRTGVPTGSDSGAVPSGWSVAFTATTQELVPTLTMHNPSGTAAAWTATGAFRATETYAQYDGGGGTTVTATTATTADLLVTASGFDGNLATTDDTLQEIAQKFDDFTAAGTGDVTAASNFAVDNVLIRSNGTTKGVQATGWTIADTNEAAVLVDGAGEVALEIQATGASGFAIDALAQGVAGIAVLGTNTTGAGWGVVGLSSVSGGVGLSARSGDAAAIPFEIINSGNFVQSQTFAGTAARTIAWPDMGGVPAISAAALTAGRIPFATTGGALTDEAALAYDSATNTISTDSITTTTTNVGSIVFEGATADANETTIAVTDPTADRTWTIPDATDTAVGKATTDTLTAKTVARNGALGTDDTLTGNTITGLTAGATIAQWEAVFIDGSSTYQLADANGSSTYPARGLAVAAYSSTNAAVIVTEGTVRNDAWAWTPGGTIYLSATAGGLTQTAPSTTGDKVQVIGYALTADIMMVNPSADYGTAP